MLLGALAAPQRYLRHLASWLASVGYTALTFDYRGVGESLLSGDVSTNLDDWGVDVRAAAEHLVEQCAPRRLLVLGHSLGGMLLGHSGVGDMVDGALLVGATHGRPELYRGMARLRIEAAYRVLPGIARRLGGLPGWSFLLRAPVPRDVVVQWTRWGRGRFATWSGEPSSQRFRAFRGPLIGVAILDDDFAPWEAVDALLDCYDAAGARRVILDPTCHGGEPMGHFGLFRADVPSGVHEALQRWLSDLRAAAG